MTFEEDLKIAVTSIVEKYPDVTHLDAFNALQTVSHKMMIELREGRILREVGNAGKG